MRNRVFAVLALALSAAACDGAPTAAPTPERPRLTTSIGYTSSISVPDVLYANSEGFCDIPVTLTNWGSTPMVVDSGSVNIYYYVYNQNAAAFQALLGNAPPNSSHTSVIPDASLQPHQHLPAPYNGRVVIKVFDSGYAYGYWADLQFHCEPYKPPKNTGNPPAEWP